ncbi:MAG TPA: outer membrane porin GjpA [Mycobacterium sp.]|nr:outer membrane porin GjpA [Mycobacterium sp.]
MESRIRPYTTAGEALVGASLIAVTPVAPPPTDIAVSQQQVALSAAVDPIGPWTDLINESSANATVLGQTFFQGPGPVLQQLIVNQLAHLSQVLDDPASITDIATQVGDNLQKAFETATFLGVKPDPETMDPLTQSNDAFHAVFAALLPMFLPEGDPTTTGLITQAVNFLASPLSGVLIGSVGPVISPLVAIANSFAALADAEDPVAGLQELVAMPANAAGAFFNGATLNLDGLLPVISGALPMPEGISIDSLSLAFGGLLTPGGTALGPEGGEPALEYDQGIGGSIFNSLGLSVGLFGGKLDIPGKPVGPIGALVNLSQMVSGALGWDGTGNPLDEMELPSAPDILESPAALAAPQGPAELPASLADPETPTVDLSAKSELTAPAADPDASDPADQLKVKESADDTLTALSKADEGPAVKRNLPGSKLAAALKDGGTQVKEKVSNLGKTIRGNLFKKSNKKAASDAVTSETSTADKSTADTSAQSTSAKQSADSSDSTPSTRDLKRSVKKSASNDAA